MTSDAITLPLFLGLAVAGGAGAALRFVVDDAVQRRARRTVPIGILIVNVSGSLVLGALVGAVIGAGPIDPSLAAVLGSGLIGGYTTFSTASVDVVRLLRQRRLALGIGYGLGTLVLSVAAAAIGLALGALL